MYYFTRKFLNKTHTRYKTILNWVSRPFFRNPLPPHTPRSPIYLRLDVNIVHKTITKYGVCEKRRRQWLNKKTPEGEAAERANRLFRSGSFHNNHGQSYEGRLYCATFCTRYKDVCAPCTLGLRRTPESALSGHRPVLLAPGCHSRCQLIWLVRSFVAFRATDSWRTSVWDKQIITEAPWARPRLIRDKGWNGFTIYLKSALYLP